METIQQEFNNIDLNDSLGTSQPLVQSGGRRKKPARAHHTLQPTISDTQISNQFYQQQNVVPPTIPQQSPVDAQPVSQHTIDDTNNYVLAEQRLLDQEKYNSTTFDTSRNSILPMKTTQFYSVDTGSCDPRIMSLTMYNIPESETLRNCTKLPIGLNLQPFAPTLQLNTNKVKTSDSEPSADLFEEKDETQIQTHFNEVSKDVGIIRCPRCRAYNNHNFIFSPDNQYMTCNLCKTQSKNPILNTMSLNSVMNMPGMRMINMNGGCTDMEAPKEYWHVADQESKPLHYVFMIDISSFANMNKSSLAAIEATQNAIEVISNKQPNCKVAILGFDRNLHFFKLSADLQKAKEFIVGDLYGDTRNKGNESGSVFIPIYQGLFVKPGESMHVIQDCLQQLKDHAMNNTLMHLPDICFGPAVEAAMMMLKEHANGGKIMTSLNTLPVYARGSLQLRKDDAFQKNLKFGDQDYYRALGNKLLREACSIDIFVTTSAFVDLCNIGYLCLNTGGEVHYYPHFQSSKDDLKLESDYIKVVSSTIGYQCALKIRTSNGLRVDSYYDQTSMFERSDPQFPVITNRSNVSCLLKLDGTIKESDVHIQAAILYTDLNGQRRIRVINTSAAVTNNVSEVYKFVDQENVADIIIKGTCVSLRYQATDYETIRKNIDNKMSEIMVQYKTTTNNHKLNNMAVIPQSLKFLPTLLLSFEKSLLMQQAKQSTRGNDRVNAYFSFLTLPLNELMLKVYPQIIPMHVGLLDEDLEFYDQGMNLLNFKSSSSLKVNNSLKSLENGGMYLIFNGSEVWVSYNQNTNPLLLKDLLDYDMSNMPLMLSSGIFPITDSEINKKARNLLMFWCKKINITSGNNGYLKCEVLYPYQQSTTNNVLMSVDQYNNIMRYQIMFEDPSVEKIPTLDQYMNVLNGDVNKKIDKKEYVSVGSVQTKAEEATFAQKYMHF
ncbi:related to SED5-binding protein 3 [Hanseniaspora guilliermondii]|uniref:Related to SED5-binding protein 3 n=1 Tax=Hanseniaspora guilliermondii TaxID=56406 RepID=A0A1L0B6H6_9ASCO|nr:related to SED5-binding protein 3 [Hanseniaspora guilliermondii]